MEFTFTLIYRLAPTETNADELVERLAEAGCDDALVGIGHPGRIALEFVREAPTARDAVESALRDAQRAMPTATLIEVSPDLVGITDVAEITGVTRQNIRKLLITRAATAPAPVHAGNPSLWHLTDLLSWLGEEMHYAFPPATLEVALVAEQINIGRQTARLAGTADDLFHGIARGLPTHRPGNRSINVIGSIGDG